MGIFLDAQRAANSAVLGRIWLKLELVRDIIDVLVICKYEEDPIKIEGARVLTRLYDFLARLHEVQKSYCSHPGRTRSRFVPVPVPLCGKVF